jgi:hypothetical protein
MDFLNRYFLNTPSKKDHNKAAIAYLATLDHLSEHHKEIADAIIDPVLGGLTKALLKSV